MIKIPKCPKCGAYATDPIEISILEELTKSTYEELYECHCGCRFVALIPRQLDDEMRVHRVAHEEKKFCLSTLYC